MAPEQLAAIKFDVKVPTSRGSTSVVRRVPMTNQKKKGGPPERKPPNTAADKPGVRHAHGRAGRERLPEGDDWTYELKFDGYRAPIVKDRQRVELRSRKNKDLTGMYGNRGGGPAGECRPGGDGR